MIVGSPLEIYTTALGWAWYNTVWDVLSSTGIVFLPFLGMIIDTWRESYVDGGSEGGATRGVRSLEWQVYPALFVIAIAAVPNPLTPLALANITYNPPASSAIPSPTAVSGGDPSTPLGASFAPGTNANVNVPAWWYFTMTVSEGLNQSIITGMSGTNIGIRQIQAQAGLSGIANPILRGEAQRFYSDCYIPARARLLSATPSAAVQAAIATYGQEDTEWIGSHAFRDDPNLYAALYPKDELPGWPFNSADPSAADVSGDPVAPTYARPTCKDWWEDDTRGLREKLVNEANVRSIVDGTTFSTSLSAVFAGWSAESQSDAAAIAALSHTENLLGPTAEPAGLSWLDQSSKLVKGIGHDVLGTTMAIIAYVIQWVSTSVIIPGLRVLQPLLLLGIYTLLPLYLVLARYSLPTLTVGAMGIFTIKFWSVLYFMADWLDEKLIQAFYPGSSDVFYLLIVPLAGDLTNGAIAKRILIDMAIVSMYFALPALWTGMMAWASITVGHGLSNVSDRMYQNSIGPASQIPLLGRLGRLLKSSR